MQPEYLRIPEDADDSKVYNIDVSQSKGVIDWQKMVSARSKSSYAKATDWDTSIDSCFDETHQAAGSNSVSCDADRFISLATAATHQAGNFLEACRPPCQSDDLAPVLDLETDGGASTGRDRCEEPAGRQIVGRGFEWLAIIKTGFGACPSIYCNKTLWETRFGSEGHRTADCEIWKSRFSRFRRVAPQMPPGLEWAIWQSTEHSKIAGIGGHVDATCSVPNFEFAEVTA